MISAHMYIGGMYIRHCQQTKKIHYLLNVQISLWGRYLMMVGLYIFSLMSIYSEENILIDMIKKFKIFCQYFTLKFVKYQVFNKSIDILLNCNFMFQRGKFQSL